MSDAVDDDVAETGGDVDVESLLDQGQVIEKELDDSADTPALKILTKICLLYTSPSPRDQRGSRMPSSA